MVAGCTTVPGEKEFPAEPEDLFRPVSADLLYLLAGKPPTVTFRPSDKYWFLHGLPRNRFVHTQYPCMLKKMYLPAPSGPRGI
jgi:hypothetical protein